MVPKNVRRQRDRALVLKNLRGQRERALVLKNVGRPRDGRWCLTTLEGKGMGVGA